MTATSKAGFVWANAAIAVSARQIETFLNIRCIPLSFIWLFLTAPWIVSKLPTACGVRKFRSCVDNRDLPRSRHARGLGLECEHRLHFRWIDVENPVQAHQLEGSPNLLGQPAQFEIALPGSELPQAGKHRAQSRAVHETHAAQIEHDFRVRLEQRRAIALELGCVARG